MNRLVQSRSPVRLIGLACALIGSVGVLGGCGHTEPLSPGGFGSTVPPGDGEPIRLTESRAGDWSPAWAPDGSGILYSYESDDDPIRDRCLAELPPGGGRRIWRLCNRDPNHVKDFNQLDRYDAPALNPDGRIAYIRTRAESQSALPALRVLAIVNRNQPSATEQVVLQLPLVASPEMPYRAMTHLRWLDPNRLLALGSSATYIAVCDTCRFDETDQGLAALIIDLDNGTYTAIPGTDSAVAVAAAGADTVFYAPANQSVVYRRLLSSGQTSTLYDFGAGHAVVDLDVAGGRLAASVDDTLAVVDLSSGEPIALPAPAIPAARVALSPSGKQVVVQDTLYERADLWMVPLP